MFPLGTYTIRIDEAGTLILNLKSDQPEIPIGYYGRKIEVMQRPSAFPPEHTQ